MAIDYKEIGSNINEARESMNLPMYLYLPTGLSEQDKELILLRIDKKLSFDKIAEYYFQ